MRSSPDFEKLAEQFTELKEPNVLLAKELYAHFGLTFYVFGLVEHSLVNAVQLAHVYSLYTKGTVRTPEQWEAAWDNAERRVHRLTFGQLVGEAKTIQELSDLVTKLTEANANRNYFAHRFFRETAEYYQSEEGTKLLLVKLAQTRRNIENLDDEVHARTSLMLQRMKLPALDLQRIEMLQGNAVARANAEIAAGSVVFGWKP